MKLGDLLEITTNIAPYGYAFCRGQELSVTKNPSLFSVLGYQYGGDGTTLFKLPDFSATRPGVCICITGEIPATSLESETSLISTVANGGSVVTENSSIMYVDYSTTNKLPNSTYDNLAGTLTSIANVVLNPIDVIIATVGDIILVQHQYNKFENGLYTVTAVGVLGVSQFILTRIEEYDQTAEIFPSIICVLNGTIYKNKYFLQKTVDPVIGTDSLIFESAPVPVQTLQTMPLAYVDVYTESALTLGVNYTSGGDVLKPGLFASLIATVNGVFPTLQGVASVLYQKVLVKNQANPLHNGDYVLMNKGSLTSKYRLVRIASTSDSLYPMTWSVLKGTGRGKFFQQDNSTLTTANIGVVGAITFTDISPVVSSGVFGISNSSGVYTYYATLVLAMAGASSGDTIKLFANFTAIASTTHKNGVNIDLNGYTITMSLNTTDAILIDNGVTGITGTISNGKFLRTGRSAGTTDGYCMNYTGASTDLTFKDFVCENTFGTACFLTNGVYKGSLSAKGYLYGVYSSVVTLTGITGESTTSSSGLRATTTGTGYNVIGISDSGSAIKGFTTYNSVAKTISGQGVESGSHFNTSSNATTGIAFSSAVCYNCTGKTSSGTVYDSCEAYECSGVSATGKAWDAFGGGYICNNSYLQSSGNIVANIRGTNMFKTTIVNLWNNSAGHGLNIWTVNTTSQIIDCTIAVANSSAYCLTGANGSSAKYIFTNIGATNPVNTADVAQNISNTQDSQGNITI